jgi:trigger factor
MTDETHPAASEPDPAPTAAAPGPESSTEAAGTAVAEPTPETPPAGDGEEKKDEKLHQTVEMTDIGPCKKHIKVTIDRADIDRKLDEKYRELVFEANVPGFRPGKAPRTIVVRKFQKEVNDQVRGQLLLQSLEQLADEHEVAPLSAPDINPAAVEIPKEGPLVYEFDVEVRPEFDLPNYRGLKLRRPVRTFSDEDVEAEEKRILAPYGQRVPKPEGDAQVGDYVTVDMTARDGERLLGELKELTLRVDPRLAFKDGVAEKFAEQVRGAKAGDKRVVDITMADAVADPSLRGKTVQATLDVKDVKALRLPELTHEFLHTFDVHSREQLREQIRVLLQRRLEYTQRQSARDQVIGQIAVASQWELPRDLLVRQARKALNRKVMEMRDAGMPEEEIRGRQRLLEQDVLQSTALSLKEHFVLQKIAEVEKIEVDDDDINDEIERIAEQNNESPRRLRARLEKEDMIDTLAAQIIERKTLDLILQEAEYEDVPLDRAAESAGRVSTVEEQAVPGEMKDPTAAPAAEEEKAAAGETAAAPEGDKVTG